MPKAGSVADTASLFSVQMNLNLGKFPKSIWEISQIGFGDFPVRKIRLSEKNHKIRCLGKVLGGMDAWHAGCYCCYLVSPVPVRGTPVPQSEGRLP
jgi:hypothetical protein